MRYMATVYIGERAVGERDDLRPGIYAIFSCPLGGPTYGHAHRYLTEEACLASLSDPMTTPALAEAYSKALGYIQAMKESRQSVWSSHASIASPRPSARVSSECPEVCPR